MKFALLLSISFISLSGFAANQTMKLKPLPLRSVTSTETSVQVAQPDAELNTKAVVTTNLTELTKSRVNLSVNVMMNNYAALALSYGSSSEREAREKLGNQQLTVDRTTTGIGMAYYFFGVEAARNIAVTPSLIFQSEKDAVNTENNSGLGVKLVGIFKPTQKVLFEGGINSTIVAGNTKGEGYLGLGLLF